jgi:hypothetical protein
MSLIFDLERSAGPGMVRGECANCGAEVFEARVTLDDAYNVWVGRCHSCSALNFLSMSYGLRGYDAACMKLVLPTDEEKRDNGLPDDCPTRGPGGARGQFGTAAGFILHQILGES